MITLYEITIPRYYKDGGCRGFDVKSVFAHDWDSARAKSLELYGATSTKKNDIRIKRRTCERYSVKGSEDGFDPQYYHFDCPKCGEKLMTNKRRKLCVRCGSLIRVENYLKLDETDRLMAHANWEWLNSGEAEEIMDEEI